MSQQPSDHDGRLRIDITTEPTIDGVIVTPHGDIDLTTSEALRVAVERSLDDGSTAVILDLSDVAFMDSTALGVLVMIFRRLGERFVLAAVQATVLRLLEITKFSSVLRLTDSVDAARTTLRPDTTE